MIEFGETLRKTREARGLTTSEVAQKTHMLVQQVEALEKEDFSKIAAPIYGRGFVRLYCEAVGIEDPKPLVDEFMDIFSGNRPPTIRMRQTVPVAEDKQTDAKTIPAAKPRSAAPPPITNPVLTGESQNSVQNHFESLQADEDILSPAQPSDSDAFSVAQENFEIPDDTVEEADGTEPDNEEYEAVPDVQDDSEVQDGLDIQDQSDEQDESGEPPSLTDEPEDVEPILQDETKTPPDNLFDFALESQVASAIPPAREECVSAGAADGLAEESPAPSPFNRSQGPSRYSAPRPIEYENAKRIKIPPVVWRTGILAVGAILLLWLLFAGIRAVYRATQSTGEEVTASETAESTSTSHGSQPPSASATESGKTAPSAKPRTPMKIKPLYID